MDSDASSSSSVSGLDSSSSMCGSGSEGCFNSSGSSSSSSSSGSSSASSSCDYQYNEHMKEEVRAMLKTANLAKWDLMTGKASNPSATGNGATAPFPF